MQTRPNRWIGAWLLFIAFLVYIMIGVGGYTRLSDSGLSMVKWKPATGWLPPLSQKAWEIEFSHYKEKPQYQKVNSTMTLDGFKKIYYPEFLHRLFGRIIGLAFFLPFCFFVATKKLKGKKLWLYLGIGLLGGLQGGIGWFMVKSGLVNDPHVSAYRLALHLCLAGFILWICFVKGIREMFFISQPLKKSLSLFLLFIALQITTGAFVSGQKAGVAFQATMTFQSDIFWLPELGLKNIVENVATILLIHISLGSLLFVFASILSIRQFLKNGFKVPLLFFIIAIFLQVFLGWYIAAHYTPRPLALSLIHQLLAFLVLLSLTICAMTSQNSQKFLPKHSPSTS